MLAAKLQPTYSVFDKINDLLSDPDLTPSECKIMVGMVTACGSAGRTFYSVRKFATRIAMSESRVRHILCDLVRRGYLIRNERPRLANEWVIPCAQGQHGMPDTPHQYATDDIPMLKNVHKEKTLNVVEKSKQENVKPKASFDMTLIREIEAVVGSSRDRGCWITIVRKVDADTIYSALSNLKISMNEGIVAKPGGYLVNAIKKYYPDIFEKSAVNLADNPKPAVKAVAAPTPEPQLTPAEMVENSKNAVHKLREMMGWDYNTPCRKGNSL